MIAPGNGKWPGDELRYYQLQARECSLAELPVRKFNIRYIVDLSPEDFEPISLDQLMLDETIRHYTEKLERQICQTYPTSATTALEKTT